MFLGATVVVRLLGVVSIAFLGRLLTPADFGVVALATVVVGLFEAMTNRQFELALIRTPNATAAHFDTAFTMSALWGATAGLATFALAGPVGAAMDSEALSQALRWLALVPLIDGLRNPYFASHEKGLRFAPAVVLETGAGAALTGVSIALAFLWRDYWAIVGGLVAQSLTRTALTYALAQRRPGPGLAHLRDFFAFGGWLTGAGLLGFLGRRADAAVVGAWLDVAQAGQYHVGYEMSRMLARRLANPLQRAVYPGLATLGDRPERLRAAYFKTQNTILGFVMPLGVGLALTAPEAIRIVAGPQWAAAAFVVQLVAPAMAFNMITVGTQPLVMVEGATRSFFNRNALVVAVTLPTLVAGAATFGLAGVVWARIFSLVFATAVTLRMAGRIVGVPLHAFILKSGRTLLASAAMAGVVLGARPLLPAFDGSLEAAVASLALKAAIGGLTYGVVHAALWAAASFPDGFERTLWRLSGALLRRARGRPG